MKTFHDLREEVVEKGFCHRCGGCVSFCTAVNFGALGFDKDGFPTYIDEDRCIECGICYLICPEPGVYEKEVKEMVGWQPPMGSVLALEVARAVDPAIRALGTDGGVVTAILVHLLQEGFIDGAVVAKKTGPFQVEPVLATTPEELLQSAGFYFDVVHGMYHKSKVYSTFTPSFQGLRPAMKEKLRRIALVGTPCQIKALRKMQYLQVSPSETIFLLLGLFCSGHFSFGEQGRRRLEEIGGFKWDDIEKINLKDRLIIRLKSGEVKNIPLTEIEPLKRPACKYCDDYSAEFADLSFGGLGAPDGWTTVVARSKKGRAVLAEARYKVIEEFPLEQDPQLVRRVRQLVEEYSTAKRKRAQQEEEKLHQHPLKKSN